MEEEALEEVAIGLVMVATVAHQTGAGPQLGCKQARRRKTSNSWKMKMMMKMKSLQSIESQEKGASRGKDNKGKLTNGSRLRYLVAVSTFFNQLIKYLFLFFNEGMSATISLINHCCQA